MSEKDPLEYTGEKDLTTLQLPAVVVTPVDHIQAEVTMEELAGISPNDSPMPTPSLIGPDGEFNRPRSRAPSYDECEVLGNLVARGLTLELACSLLTPPLRYEKVEKSLNESYKRKTIFRRAQAIWLNKALQVLLTRPAKEICGLIFVLKNRHGKMFDANRIKLDVTSAGSPLQLTSPEVIERAREYALKNVNTATVIDVQEVVKELPVMVSDEERRTPERRLESADRRDSIDKQRAKAYLDSLIEETKE